MANEKGVKELESPTDDKSGSPSDEGHHSSKPGDERSLENVLAENKRKAEEIRELKDQLESVLEDKEERLAELQEKSRLSTADKEEMSSLEDQITAIRRDPRAKAWNKLTEETAGKAADARAAKLANELTEDYIEELAEKEGQPLDKFEREMVKFMRRVDPGAELNTFRRAKKAYKMFLQEREYSEKMEKLKEKEQQFQETNNRPPKPQSKKEIMEGALKSDKGLEEVLKGIHSVQHEATSR